MASPPTPATTADRQSENAVALCHYTKRHPSPLSAWDMEALLTLRFLECVHLSCVTSSAPGTRAPAWLAVSAASPLVCLFWLLRNGTTVRLRAVPWLLCSIFTYFYLLWTPASQFSGCLSVSNRRAAIHLCACHLISRQPRPFPSPV